MRVSVLLMVCLVLETVLAIMSYLLEADGSLVHERSIEAHAEAHSPPTTLRSKPTMKQLLKITVPWPNTQDRQAPFKSDDTRDRAMGTCSRIGRLGVAALACFPARQ